MISNELIVSIELIGIDRTYFGSELGLVPAKWVTQFPYGYIPHPMITSQLFALLGFFKAAHFRANLSIYMIPIHITLYSIHMIQEQFDIHHKHSDEYNNDDNNAIENINEMNYENGIVYNTFMNNYQTNKTKKE